MKYTVDKAVLDKFTKNVVKDSNKALLYCWEYLAWKLKEAIQVDSYDTWALHDSITWQKVRDWVVEVWSNLDYAVIREYWRRPWKFPPLDVIAEWTARKGMITWWVNTWYDNLHYIDRWIVFIVARAIAKRWIEWKLTFNRVFNEEKKNVLDIYTDYMKRW